MGRRRRYAQQLISMACVATAIASSAAADWYDPAWNHRVALSVDSVQIAGGGPFTDLSLVVIMDQEHFDELFLNAQADGSDLLVTGQDGLTPWDFELVSFDPVAKSAELWLRAPVFSAAESGFYIYFGNSDPLLVVDPGEAFAADYLAVYHFDDTPGNGALQDSSPHGNFALEGPGSTWNAGKLAPAQVGRGWNFDGVNDWIYTENVSSADSSFTISAWHSNLWGIEDGSTALQSESGYWNVSFQRSGQIRRPDLEAAGSMIVWEPEAIDDSLHHYVWVMDGVNDVARFFFDGVEQNVYISYSPGSPGTPYTGTNLGGRVGIGGPVFFNPFDLSDGFIDEFRIYEGTLDADRIRTEYNNQSSPESFYICVFEQLGATPTDPANPVASLGRISVWPNPFQSIARIDIELGSTIGDVSIFDLAGRRIRALSPNGGLDRIGHLQWDGRDDRGQAVGGGVYFVRARSEHGTVDAKLLLVR